MENSKESVRKCYYTDTFNSSQETNSSKTSTFKTNQCPNLKSSTEGKSTSRKTFVIKKSLLCPSVDKNSPNSIYGNDSKPVFKKQTFVKREGEIDPKSHAVTGSKDHFIKSKEGESELDLNGNLSFQGSNVSRDFCHFSYPVSKSPYLEKAVNHQSLKFNELPRTKCSKYSRQRTVFFEKRALCPKIVNNSLCHPFTGNKTHPSVVTNTDSICSCEKGTSPELKALVHHVKASLSISKGNFESCPFVQTTVDNQSRTDAKCSVIPDILAHSEDSVGLLNVSKSNDDCLDKKSCLSFDKDEFRIVKRQRKRLPKRWDQESATSTVEIDCKVFNHSEKMLFPALPASHHSRQEKLDSSHTCSMPPSEHSSAENSDLESVHSLPIVGTVNYSAPTRITTSATSTIPQASYADVIRMSAPVADQSFTASECDKNAVLDQQGEASSAQDGFRKDDTNIQPGSSEWVISRLSQLDQNSNNPLNTNIVLTHSNQNEQNFGASRPIVVSLEKPSFFNSSLQVNKNVVGTLAPQGNLPSPDGKVVDNRNLTYDCSCNLEKMPVTKLHEKLSFFSGSAHSPGILGELSYTTAVASTSLKTDSVYSSPSSISSSICDAFKPADNSSLKTQALTKVPDPPVIIMNNCMPPENMSDISFGIEYEEMVKLCADNLAGFESNVSPITVHDSSDSCFSEKTLETDDSEIKSLKTDVTNDCAKGNIIDTEDQNPCNGTMISVGGKTLYWKDSDVDSRRSNLEQLTGYFNQAWKEIEKDYKKGSSASSGKIVYFHEL